MKSSLKRLLSLLLCLCIVAAMTVLPVLAEETEPTLSEEEQRKAAEIAAGLAAIDEAADKKAEQTVLLREQAADRWQGTYRK